MAIDELFLAFVENPSSESYLTVHEGLVRSSQYNPYSDEVEKAGELLGDGQLDAALEMLSDSMSNLCISPQAHLTMAAIHEEMGSESDAKFYAAVAGLICSCIIETGDGTQEDPYIVARISDEYDVMRFLGKHPVRQSAIQLEGRMCDRIICDDDSVLWFDVSDAWAKMPRSSQNQRRQS